MDISKGILNKDKRALARAITLIENNNEQKEDIIKDIFSYTGKSHVIGITGSPGAGKSSLVDKMTAYIRQLGFTVGVIAIDPTSPFTGGALLGDRIRMQNHFLDPGVFIRSMGTRGSLGGLSKAAKDAVKVFDAYGMDFIIIETVGVGQSELDIMYAADTTVVVLTPGAGDVVQTLKAGIMEIADIFAVNKADISGADKVVTEVNAMLDLKEDLDWKIPVIKVVSISDTGIDSLYQAVDKHKNYLKSSGMLFKKREERLNYEILESALNKTRKILMKELENKEEISLDIKNKDISPDEAANILLKHIKNIST